MNMKSNRLEDEYIELMKRNRDLRMELLLYAEELDNQSEPVNPHEVADKLIEFLNKNSPYP